MTSNSLVLLGKRLRELRVKRGLSQERLSELCGVSSRHISEMERGESNPSFQIMEQLTSALGVSMKELFDFEHQKERDVIFQEALIILEQMPQDKLKIAHQIIKIL